MTFPSGDQLGLPTDFAFMSVSLTGFVPSLLHTQTSLFPELLDTKAILRPSGEITGCISSEDHESSGFDGGFNSFSTAVHGKNHVGIRQFAHLLVEHHGGAPSEGDGQDRIRG
jgi:hypothetical protein